MTRTGKIARLPRAVREKLNERLDNGESAVQLVAWLNGLPEVQKVLAENFGGRAIGPQNLSDWKGGGFVEWQARQETLEQARELAAEAEELDEATENRLSDSLATVLEMRYAKLLAGWDGRVTEEFSAQLRVLRSMCLDVGELRRGDHNRERLGLERERLGKQRELPEREVLTPEEKEARFAEIFGLVREDVKREDGNVDEGEDENENEDEDEGGTVAEASGTPAPQAATPMADGTAKGENEISRSEERADEASALLSEPGTVSPGGAQETEPIKVDQGRSSRDEGRAGEGPADMVKSLKKANELNEQMGWRPGNPKSDPPSLKLPPSPSLSRTGRLTGGRNPNPEPGADGLMVGMSASMLLRRRQNA